jgi:hypothetical protein
VNTVTAFIGFGTSVGLGQILYTDFNPLTLLFNFAHEGSDFVLGALLVPTFTLVIPKAKRVWA